MGFLCHLSCSSLCGRLGFLCKIAEQVGLNLLLKQWLGEKERSLYLTFSFPFQSLFHRKPMIYSVNRKVGCLRGRLVVINTTSQQTHYHDFDGFFFCKLHEWFFFIQVAVFIDYFVKLLSEWKTSVVEVCILN